MTDLYLRAADEAAARDALRPLGLLLVDPAGVERWRTGHRLYALEPGVPVVIAPATLDATGAVIAPASLAPGFHLNLRVLDPVLAAAVHATGLVLDPPPASPQRVFG